MIAGLILTGGKNTRMNGNIKLFLEYNGMTFFSRIKNSMASLSKIYLSVDKTESYEKFAMPLIVDEFDSIGPIGGIYSALKNIHEEAVLVCASDMPFLTRAAVDLLTEKYERSKKFTLAFSNNQVQPLLGVYPKKILPVIEKMIEQKIFRVNEILNRVEYELVPLPENDNSAENINTHAEYMQKCRKPFFFAVSGYKHTGKTTLITKLIPELIKAGYKVAVIKHDGHDFIADTPGTDSFKHKQAGAYATAVFSENRILIHKETKCADENIIASFFPEADIILLEGFKGKNYPKYICNYPSEEIISPEKLAAIIIQKYKAQS